MKVYTRKAWLLPASALVAVAIVCGVGAEARLSWLQDWTHIFAAGFLLAAAFALMFNADYINETKNAEPERFDGDDRIQMTLLGLPARAFVWLYLIVALSALCVSFFYRIPADLSSFRRD